MKRKIQRISAVMLAAFVGVILAAGTAGQPTDKQMTLSGIDAFYVFVQGLMEETKKEGITAEQIQSEVEGKLKQMGIKVVSEEEGMKIAGSPVLYVNISAKKKVRTPEYIFHVDLGVLQKVALVREPEIRSMSITWNRGQIGSCPSISLAKSLRDTVGYLMDRFQEDYQTVNPRQSEEER